MKVLVAGATGYLGSHIVAELLHREMDVLALARNPEKLLKQGVPSVQIITAEATDPTSLAGCCDGVEVVISALGITRQRDGLTYMDVDYQANKNILDEARRAGIRKFIYVSVLRGNELTHLQICAAKERFVNELEQSELDYTIIRPSGFFSDLTAFYDMAKGGRIFLFGDGQILSNPIHGADLAEVCVDAIGGAEQVIEVGGPEQLSQQDIVEIAFLAAGKPQRITYIPDWVRRFLLRLARIFMSKAAFGPAEFFLHVLVMDMRTKAYGNRTISSFFQQLKNKES